MKVLELIKILLYFVVAQRTLPWQLILEAKSVKLPDLPLFVMLVFQNELECQNADGRLEAHLMRFSAVTP